VGSILSFLPLRGWCMAGIVGESSLITPVIGTYIGIKLLLIVGVNLQFQERSVLKKVAWQIVRNCLRVRENDMVTLNTWHHTIDLAEEIAFGYYKVGTVPLVTLMTNNLLYRRIMNELPAENLAETLLHA